MESLRGVISDRIRALFGPKSKTMNPGRPADVPPPRKAKPVPKGVEGHQLGGRHRKGK